MARPAVVVLLGAILPGTRRTISLHQLSCAVLTWLWLYGATPAIGCQALDQLYLDVRELASAATYAEKIPIVERALAGIEVRVGRDAAEVGAALFVLAELNRFQGHLNIAEEQYKRSLAICDTAQYRDSISLARILDGLALVYQAQGRFAEAEPIYNRTLGIRERSLGAESVEVAQSLFVLGLLNHSTGRLAQAEKLYKRSIEIIEKAKGPKSTELVGAIMNLGILYHWMGRLSEAESQLKRALALTNDANLSTVLDSLVRVYIAQGRYDEAEPHELRALDIRTKTLGPDHPNIATSLDSLATINIGRGKLGDALPLLERETAIFENIYGSDHPWVAQVLSRRAIVSSSLGDLSGAAQLLRRGVEIAIAQERRDIESLGRPLTISAQTGSGRLRGLFPAYIQITDLLDRKSVAKADVGSMLEMAQWSTASEAASSIAKMAARTAKGSGELAQLVRERQDLVAEWTAKAQMRVDLRSEPVGRRDASLERSLTVRSAQIDARLAEIDQVLKKDFPDYGLYASPEPLAVTEIRSFLHDDEALVFLFPVGKSGSAPDQTFLWVVTKGEVRWVRSDLGTPALTREVDALRCGLDASLWDDEEAAKRCRSLVTGAPRRDKKDNVRTETLPFDAARAHALYKALFGQVEDLIQGKHLLIVPSGPLTQLPLQVLVTAAPSGTDHRATQWLARQHALTVLPAVSSLKALRRDAKVSAASKLMLGVGNPLLDGSPADAQSAKLARQKQACANLPPLQEASTGRKGRGVPRVITSGGHPSPAALRTLSPLDETADELCAVAKDLKLSPDDILLGARATETTLKGLDLASYRVIHFATHGMIAGEIRGSSEPGLILTPPREATDLDDGYLSASEVAALKLDADWVILSACNTAAGGAAGAEALSGLARAFIYAGARALLVSHWAVDSSATVKLITSAVGATARDAKLGRAEALRRAMLALIDKGEPREAHPAYWAPFVVVGEGAVATVK
jgi:CHAT domain-containing protein/tetratricopeptide (TPR) repeat protein